MQDAARPQDSVIFSVVGWHALTLPQDPKALLQSKNDMFATLIAIGLDPEKSIIFHQDDVCLLFFSKRWLSRVEMIPSHRIKIT